MKGPLGTGCLRDPPEALVCVIAPAPPWAEQTPAHTSLVTPQHLGPGFLPGSPV